MALPYKIFQRNHFACIKGGIKTPNVSLGFSRGLKLARNLVGAISNLQEIWKFEILKKFMEN